MNVYFVFLTLRDRFWTLLDGSLDFLDRSAPPPPWKRWRRQPVQRSASLPATLPEGAIATPISWMQNENWKWIEFEIRRWCIIEKHGRINFLKCLSSVSPRSKPSDNNRIELNAPIKHTWKTNTPTHHRTHFFARLLSAFWGVRRWPIRFDQGPVKTQ